MDRESRGSGIRVLVTGATGMQGGATARALRRAGLEVSALVRTPEAESARALAGEDIALAVGDLEDPASLKAACAGHTTVFSVQPAPFADRDSERRQARNLIEAAREAGVDHFVHASVSGTGWRALHPDVDPGGTRNYWDSKEAVEQMVRDAGFDTYTIFKPAFYMDNFVAPKVDFMFPDLAAGELLAADGARTELALIASADIGAATTAAVTDRRRFAGAEIELAGDVLTFDEIGQVIAKAADRPVSTSFPSVDEVDARMGKRSWASTQAWLSTVGYPARPAHAAGYGLKLTTFERWADQHRGQLRAGIRPRL
ncbi:NmrA family NAD(P)-binding protein [Actinomadura sp. LOL_016]|uniref:NmrA family NAD(P)-binding protein n=1 Tax=unclassified Actinomadura TaxID=2626254 RepID=UPI003A80FA20